MPKPLTIIEPIKPGERDALAAILASINADMQRNPYARLGDSPSTHFARFVIISSDTIPAQPHYHAPLPPHLMFTSNFDGSLLEYSAELKRVMPGLDEIFGRAAGYTGPDDFFMFLRDHNKRPNAFYQGFRDATVNKIHAQARLRDALEGLMDEPAIREISNAVLNMPRDPQRPQWYDYPSLLLRALGAALVDVLEAIANPILNQYVIPEPQLTERTSAVQIAAQRTEQDLIHLRNLSAVEDSGVQNQMNILSEVIPSQVRPLKRILALVNAVARVTAPGELGGISTIHFARWVLINNDKHMVFASNFDGLWEAYIGDFSRDVAGGMHAIWKHTTDFPAGGPRDIAAFEHHIRQRQIRSDVFYSAYPDLTVMNIRDDQRIAEALKPFNQEAYALTLRGL